MQPEGGLNMNLLKQTLLVLGIMIITSSQMAASNLNGGRGLMHIRSAWSLKPGFLTLYAHSRFFGKVGEISSKTAQTAVTFWDVQGSLSFNYGINQHIEVAISPIMYQDNHKGDSGYNFPDDLFLQLKFGSYGSKGSSLTFGGLLNFRFPTAKYHNLMFEPYSAGTVEWCMMGLTTYSRDPLYPEDALNAHLNLGYINHNDVGQKLSSSDRDSVYVRSMTQEISYGLGVKMPSSQFDFSIELYGNTFLQKPPQTAHSLENYLYLSPGITYKAYRWLSVDFSADFLLTNPEKDESVYGAISKIEGMPNYPSWRANLGFRFILLPMTAYRVSDRDILMRKAESRRELFEQIINEQRETESAEEELERIKEERRKAERELERLRRILEGEARKKQSKPGSTEGDSGRDQS